jgi:hypothetical protein
MTLSFESHTLWLSTCEISYWWNVLLLDVWSLYNTNHVSFDEMTQTPHYGAVWKSCLTIKCIWNLILIKCIVTRCFDVYTIQIMFLFDEMTQTLCYGEYAKLMRSYGWFQHRKNDCTLLLSIIHVDV